MITTNEKLKNHFLTHYSKGSEFSDIKKECSLTCKHAIACEFSLDHEASFSGALGDPESKIMVVAESPSTRWGKGAHITGLTAKLVNDKEIKKSRELLILLEYLKNIYGSFPYFTDFVKCGVKKTREKELLTIRKHNCVETHLIEEMKILNPEKIVCLGNDSHDAVVKLFIELYPKKKVEDHVFKITHFSRSASLPLSMKDKMNVIWKLELGLVKNREEAIQLALQLTHLIKKLPAKNIE